MNVNTIDNEIAHSDLKLRIFGGIGDSLKVMTCNLPLQDYCDKTGKKIYITYGGEGYNDCGWNHLLKENIFDRSECLNWIAEKDYIGLDLPEAKTYFGDYKEFDTFKPLTLNGETIKIDIDKYNVAIQIKGNDSRKKWQHEKYDEVCQFLLNNNPDTQIYIVDGPDTVIQTGLLEDKKIINMIGKSSLFQNIQLLGQMDLFIGPDSFSKYVCRCNNVKQILLTLDVKYVTPNEMLRNCFRGLTHNENVKLVGIEYDDDLEVSHIVNDVKEIEIREVIDAIQETKGIVK